MNIETAINIVYYSLFQLRDCRKGEQEDNEENKTSGKYKWLREKTDGEKSRKILHPGKNEREKEDRVRFFEKYL